MNQDLSYQCQRLSAVLGGCLNNNTIYQSEMELKRMSADPFFINQLLTLIPKAHKNMLSIITTTLKNYLLARYNSPDNPLPHQSKDFLRNNLFNVFYQIYPETAPTKVFKEIMHIIILVDYPWKGVHQMIESDLNDQIIASVYFFRQVAKANEYETPQNRGGFQNFIMQYFPRIQPIIEKIFQNYNEQTSELLLEIFKAFYSSFQIEIPVYLRDFNNFDKWLLFFQTILKIPSEPTSIKNQEIAVRVYLKIFMLYANDAPDGKQQYKGWAAQFRVRYCQRIFQQVVNLIGERKGNEDMQSNLVNCLYSVVKKVHLRQLFTNEHCEVFLYQNCLLPLCQSNNHQLNLFKNDPVEYIHRSQDLTCEQLRRAIMDLIEVCASCLSYSNKSELMRIIEYSASVLESSAPDPQKEVIIRILIKIGRQILKNPYLKSQFQNLTIRFFIPLLEHPNPLLNSLTCQLLTIYLPEGELDSATVSRLMQIIYGKITNSLMVIRYNAILAFTALLSHKSAREAATPHFKQILQIYVNMLNSFEHQNLIESLESIVKHFSVQVVEFAPQLISHLINIFSSFCRDTKANSSQEMEDEPDTTNPANAALSTISQLLSCQLSPQTYFAVSIELIELFRGVFGKFKDHSDAIISLFSVLMHKAANIADFNYPYVACRILLDGNKNILVNSNLPSEIINQLRTVQEGDEEQQEQILSILKNLIQKMPLDLLRRYQYPTHPQLILCLIENKKLSIDELTHLPISSDDKTWTPYIKSYINLIYGVSQVCDPAFIRRVVGVSLFPWLTNRFCPELVKFVVNAVQEEEEEDEIDEQSNTAQLLMKYVNEDDDDQDEYQEGSGINYSFYYDSPYDSTKDKQILIQQLRNMSQDQAIQFANRLSPKYRKKLQALFSQ